METMGVVPVEYQLPTTRVDLNLIQIGYLNSFVWAVVAHEPQDLVARQLFTLLKEAAIRLDVTWDYGELPPL